MAKIEPQVSPAEIHNRFIYHPPNSNQMVRYEQLRDEARELAESINKMCPDSREKALALTKLEECVMWANASIARNE